MKKIKEKIISFFKWIKEECKDYRTFLIFFFVMFIVHTPIWGGIVLYRIFKLKWGLAMATTISLFWIGPFTPFFPICIGLTFAIKRLMQKGSKKDRVLN